jgi:hypothetical protein
MQSCEVEAAAKRLCRLAAHIDADTWRAGAEWYPREAAWIAAAADHHAADIRRAINAYACLSPRLQVGQNRKAIAAMLRGSRPRGVFGRQVSAARLALKGDFGSHVVGVGLKVEAFARNLSGCPDSVTVDVWAARAAGLSPPTTDRRYLTSAHAYRLAANRLSVPARTLQAAAWLHVRGDKPSDGEEAQWAS